MVIEEINIGDEVENVATGWNSAVCPHEYNRTDIGIKGIITKRGYSEGGDCIAFEVKWENGKKCGKSINHLKLVKKKDVVSSICIW